MTSPLHVTAWGDDDAARTALLVHGITASSLAWSAVARELTRQPGWRALAPDLRGRGLSAGLPGPWGMARHADDLAALVRSQGRGPVDVVGHSMGAFVTLVFAHRHPSLVGRVLLVDGGIPLPAPAGVDVDTAMTLLLGPAVERLQREFVSVEAYRDFWRSHPAFAHDWNEDVEGYVDYDLTGSPPHLHSRCSIEAMTQDSRDLADSDDLSSAWRDLERPVHLLRAPLGLQAEPPGLYPPERVTQWAQEHPMLTFETVEDVNHYTIVMSERGARSVVDALLNRT